MPGALPRLRWDGGRCADWRRPSPSSSQTACRLLCAPCATQRQLRGSSSNWTRPTSRTAAGACSSSGTRQSLTSRCGGSRAPTVRQCRAVGSRSPCGCGSELRAPVCLPSALGAGPLSPDHTRCAAAYPKRRVGSDDVLALVHLQCCGRDRRAHSLCSSAPPCGHLHLGGPRGPFGGVEHWDFEP